MKTYDPYTAKKNFQELVKEWISDDKAGYIRV